MSREPNELDPDEARVRALIRRSDGPVHVRPFRVERRPWLPLPWVAATAAALVIGLVIGTSLSTRRQEVASSPAPSAGLPAPTATPLATPTPAPSETPVASGAPVSAGAVPEAGILFVVGSDDQIYRYSGATGGITAVSRGSTIASASVHGIILLGREGSADRLGWDAAGSRDVCGLGTVVAVSKDALNCAFQEGDGPVTVMAARSRRGVVPAGWGAGGLTWDDSGTRLALLRHTPGPEFAQRGHNALWVWEADGELRKLYEPSDPAALVSGPQWSPDGRWITVAELPEISNSIAADGWKLLLIEVATARVTTLGTTIGGNGWRVWSPAGELAFIRGAGRETWRDKRLVVRAPDGTERKLALPDADHVQIAPSWSANGDLAFVFGRSGADFSGYMDGVGVGDRRGMVLAADGRQREIRCPSGALEGIRPSADGRTFLLLCRTPGREAYPLSIWVMRPGTEAAVPLVHGLTGGIPGADGFGYYGLQPSLNTLVAWSLAAR